MQTVSIYKCTKIIMYFLNGPDGIKGIQMEGSLELRGDSPLSVVCHCLKNLEQIL